MNFRLLLLVGTFTGAVPLMGIAEPGTSPETAPAEAEESKEPAAGADGGKTNRLIHEKSPYLLQHAHNPVDWYPWGDEAFAKAKKENKPVFLSIGYATCHWCHVMEHESFEDEATAKIINEHFVPIKLDREERPDIDRIYMGYLQALSGGGGWPLNVFLTPERNPFYAGTYFPPVARGGRPSFKDMLGRISEAWEKDHELITKESGEGIKKLEAAFRNMGREDAHEEIPKETIPKAYLRLAQTFDPEQGGFGGAPKFPQPVRLQYLLGQYSADGGPPTVAPRGTPRPLEMVTQTLDAMAAGGIYDHLGGGFHRYSVDAYWHVPHFEKMLYDQAQLLSVYSAAYTLTGDENYRRVVEGIAGYADSRLRHPQGGFFSAEDADSALVAGDDHKHEGVFYVWTKEEILKALPEGDAEVFCRIYGVKEAGNAREESDTQREFIGKNILYLAATPAEIALEFGIEESAVVEKLDRSRATLFALREKRPRPILDDKVITAWNGLMISGLADAYLALGDEKYLERANSAADFILENLSDPKTGKLLRTYRDGPSEIPGFAEDYAFFVAALIDLYECDFNGERLRAAVRIQKAMNASLWDPEEGGYFDSAAGGELVMRLKSYDDGAEPSANAVAAMNLVRLSAILKMEKFSGQAEKIFTVFASQVATFPAGSTGLLTAYRAWRDGVSQIVIVAGEGGGDEVLRAVRSRYLPTAVVVKLGPDSGASYLVEENPLMEAFTATGGKTTLFLCKNFTCDAPTTSLETITKQLDTLSPAPSEER